MALCRFCTVYCTTFQAPTVGLVESGLGRYEIRFAVHTPQIVECTYQKQSITLWAGLRSSACSWKTAPQLRVVTVVRYAGFVTRIDWLRHAIPSCSMNVTFTFTVQHLRSAVLSPCAGWFSCAVLLVWCLPLLTSIFLLLFLRFLFPSSPLPSFLSPAPPPLLQKMRGYRRKDSR